MHWDRHPTSLIARLLLLVVLGGCATGMPSPTPPAPPSTPASASPSPWPSPTNPVGSPSTASAAPSLATPTTSPAGDPFVGRVVATLADRGLRVRSRPGTGSDSDKHEPLLPLGTALFVLGGPQPASGYAWYEVAAFSPGDLPRSGWVASAGKDGEPWIETRTFDCPPVPSDLASLAAMPPGVGPVCFPQLPITVRARLLNCDCDIDGAWYEPYWFGAGSGSPDVLVEPASTNVPEDFGDWFFVNLDPDGEYPAKLPYGEVVKVTGMFDHPDAAGCTLTEPDGEPVATGRCRLLFAVTRLEVVDR